MKAKIKLDISGSSYYKYLRMKLKIEKEWFYWHTCTVIDDDDISDEEFYTKVINFLSDKNEIILYGEEFMKQIIKKKYNNLITNQKESEAYRLLQQLNKPIEIEVKI
jgi:hypothetical protein